MATCAMSGVIPDVPVVSTKTGHVFEKHLVEKHLLATGTCPVTNAPMSVHDLLPLKVGHVAKPRAPSATSVPSTLQMLQSEFDTAMLESYSLRQSLDTARQELAHSLYQYDAACRVIARLVKERDEARAALSETQGNVAKTLGRAPVPQFTASSSSSAVPKDTDMAAAAGEDIGISAQVIQVMTNTSKALTKGRKKMVKEAQARATVVDVVKNWKPFASHSLHSTTSPGITCLDLNKQEQDLTLTGGADCNAILFNLKLARQVDVLKGHKKKITDVKFHSSEKMVFTASADCTAKSWKEGEDGKFQVCHTFKGHSAEITGMALHPSGAYLLTASKDKTWSLYDVATGVCREQVGDDNVQGGYTKVQFHPDGLIMGAGTQDNKVRIFDVTQRKNVATLVTDAQVTGLAFSENGYYVASGDEAGQVRLWDLRKLDGHFQTLTHSGDDSSVGSVAFDNSGSYLAVGYGDNVRVYSSKLAWEVVQTWENAHKDSVTAVQFGNDAKFLLSSGGAKDRSLKIFA